MQKINSNMVSILIGCILSLFIINHYFSRDKIFENLALGTQTIPYQAMINDTLIHLQRLNDHEESDILSHIHNRKVFLFLGNSQTHSINQKKANEVNFIELLYKRWANDKMVIRCNSVPNAGMQEYYLAYEYWKSKFKIGYLAIPLCMDDMREDGIRDVFFPKLVETKYQVPDTANEIAAYVNESLRGFWSANENTKVNTENADMAALKETVQESTEKYLNEKLESNWKLWRDRQNVRGEYYTFLYQLRNTVLRINANTIRQMIPKRYEMNMKALNAIVEDCIKNDTKVLLYIPPIRFDLALPYDMKEYEAFKKEIEQIANKYPGKVFFKNYESIIPANLWGYKEATNLTDKVEVDYMHFQYKGHQILADSFNTIIPTVTR